MEMRIIPLWKGENTTVKLRDIHHYRHESNIIKKITPLKKGKGNATGKSKVT